MSPKICQVDTSVNHEQIKRINSSDRSYTASRQYEVVS